MDVDDVHFIPKVTTTSTTPSTPSSRLPSVLTSLDIPPEYLEEILRPRNLPKVPREPPLHRQPQQEAPVPQQAPQEHTKDQSTLKEAKEHKKSVEDQNIALHNAAESQNPSSVEKESQKQEVRMESSQVPPFIHPGSKGYEGGEEGQEKSRWKWGWWNEEPSEAQQRLEEASTGPRFDRTLARKLTVQEGKTAVLACRVVNNNEKAVRVTYFCFEA